MKSESDIKQRIHELQAEGSLVALIACMSLLWVLDTEQSQLECYTSKIEEALQNVVEYIDKL